MIKLVPKDRDIESLSFVSFKIGLNSSLEDTLKTSLRILSKIHFVKQDFVHNAIFIHCTNYLYLTEFRDSVTLRNNRKMYDIEFVDVRYRVVRIANCLRN